MWNSMCPPYNREVECQCCLSYRFGEFNKIRKLDKKKKYVKTNAPSWLVEEKWNDKIAIVPDTKWGIPVRKLDEKKGFYTEKSHYFEFFLIKS